MHAKARSSHERNCFFPRTVERLLELGQVDTTGPDACWLWRMKNGSPSKKYGYGKFGVYGQGAHRVMYQLVHDVWLRPAPFDIIMHTCDNPPCVNPAHLKLGTISANTLDMYRKGRRDQNAVVKNAWDQREHRNEFVGVTCVSCGTLFCGYPYKQRRKKITCGQPECVGAAISAGQRSRLYKDLQM